MIVLGIDPGSRVMGYGLIQWGAQPKFLEAGVITAKASLPIGARLAHLASELEDFLSMLRRQGSPPVRAGIESGYMGGHSAKSDLALAMARGVALYVVADRLQIEPVFVAPATVKKAVTGSGRAEKPAVQASVKAILRMNHEPSPDAADALAVAIAVAASG